MTRCLKCGAPPTPDTADTDLPMCFAHRLDGESDSGAPPDHDDVDLHIGANYKPGHSSDFPF